MNEDLKWLAENVHEWNLRGKLKICAHKRLDGSFFVSRVYPDDFEGYTRAQWQAARDELSGKPKEWEGAWLFQDRYGFWHSFDDTETPVLYGDSPEKNYCTRKGFFKDYGRGEVLGDWRDTLERRPENHSVEPTEKVWRGPEDGLPPVGTYCQALFEDESTFDGGEWFDAYIVGVCKDGNTVAELLNEGVFVVSHKFRPIRTEEEKAVGEMIDIACKACATTSAEFAQSLYRAGYRKQEDK